MKGGRVIEALANITAVAMDKTGTITTGEFKVVDVATSSTAVTTVDVLRLAGAVEISSSHPIANSIMAETDAQYIPVTRAESIQEFAGEGLVGTLVGESLGKTCNESMVTKILDAVENAASSKPKIDRFITRFAKVYTPIVVFLALAVAIIPSLITGEWENGFTQPSLSFVISCPCALVLSVPLAFF